MHKNEEVLLPVWAQYHGKIFGNSNIYILDNGSTNPNVQSYLSDLEYQGFNINLSHNTREDFARKGEIMRNQIITLDETDPADFYFPLDCDEFLCAQDDYTTRLLFDRTDVENALRPFVGSEKILRIGAGYDNYPGQARKFLRKGRSKCFVPRNSCLFMDVGFHKVRSRHHFDIQRTPICYLHMHNKPIALLKQDAREKLIGRVPDFSDEALEQHKASRAIGYHLIDEMRCETHDDYRAILEQKYKNMNLFELPELYKKLDELGLTMPY